MKPVFYDIFKDRDDIERETNYGTNTPTEQELIYAGYTNEGYEGSAIVVFARDGKLYENNDGHCSCNGLEYWQPEETSVAALQMREGWPSLAEAVAAWEAEQKPDAEPS